MNVNFKGNGGSMGPGLARTLLGLLVLGLGAGCSNALYRVPRPARDLLATPQGFTGIHVVELGTQKERVSYHADRLFVPASTVKLLTWHRVRSSLGEQAPALAYRIRGNSIILRPLGYPYLAYPAKEDSTLRVFLQAFDTLFLDNPEEPARWAPGWSWDDYPYSYSADRALLPLYGNRLWVWHTAEASGRNSPGDTLRAHTPSLSVLPDRFTDSVQWVAHEPDEPRRSRFRNRFYLQVPAKEDTLSVPLITSHKLEALLLSDYTGRTVIPDTPEHGPGEFKIYYGVPLDSIIKPMLRRSDNYLAEQLMLMHRSVQAGLVRDSLDGDVHTYEEGVMRWVDASGLSRYNLLTPSRLTQTLLEIGSSDSLYPWRDLLSADTLELGPADFELMHVKSGSMGGVYNLAGFMRTRKGRLVAFAIMNNHFTASRAALKARTHALLREIHEAY